MISWKSEFLPISLCPDIILIFLTTGAVVVTEEEEYGDVQEDLQSARGLREPGVQRGPLDNPHCWLHLNY